MRWGQFSDKITKNYRMRVGQNPQKFARLSEGKASLDMKRVPKLSISTVVYIPRLSDYYEEAFDILYKSAAK